jgi:hypothetical protein
MPKSTDRPEGRSQNLSSAPGDMVSLDRKTCHELGKLVGKSLDQLQIVRQSEILLTSLEHHLSKLADETGDKDFEIAKGILLLRYWLDCVPEFQGDITDWLQTAFQTLQVVLATNDLGGGGDE